LPHNYGLSRQVVLKRGLYICTTELMNICDILKWFPKRGWTLIGEFSEDFTKRGWTLIGEFSEDFTTSNE